MMRISSRRRRRRNPLEAKKAHGQEGGHHDHESEECHFLNQDEPRDTGNAGSRFWFQQESERAARAEIIDGWRDALARKNNYAPGRRSFLIEGLLSSTLIRAARADG